MAHKGMFCKAWVIFTKQMFFSWKKGEAKKNQENADIIISSVKASKANVYTFYSPHLSDGKGKNLFSQQYVLFREDKDEYANPCN